MNKKLFLDGNWISSLCKRSKAEKNKNGYNFVSVVMYLSFKKNPLYVCFVRRRIKQEKSRDEMKINTSIFHFAHSYLEIFIHLICLCFIYMILLIL